MRYIWHHMPTHHKILIPFQTIIALTCWITALTTHNWELGGTATLITALAVQHAHAGFYHTLYLGEREGADLHRDLQDRIIENGAVLLEHINPTNNEEDYIRATPITHDHAD